MNLSQFVDVDTWVYDVEDYPNMFMVSFIPLHADQRLVNAYIAADKKFDSKAKIALIRALNIKTFIIFKGYYNDRVEIDDRRNLVSFMENHKIMYGYNSNNYDSIIMDIFLYHCKFYSNKTGCDSKGVHITTFLNKQSNACINYKKDFRYTLDFYKYYRRPYTDRDIQKILYLDKSFTGLKKVAINLRWYRIQELPLPPDTIINSSQVADIVDYNINDILITRALILNQALELDIRKAGSEEFGIDLNNLSRSSIGKALVTKYYSEWTGIPTKDFVDLRTTRYTIKCGELIDPNISFKTDKFNSLFNAIKASKIYITSDKDKSRWGFTLLHNGTKYIVAKGGLHSKDNAMIFDITDHPNLILRDADVTSFYPQIMLNLRVAPAHLLTAYILGIIHYIKDSRVKAKHLIKELAKTDRVASEFVKKKAEIYKIAINRIYGALKDPFDYMYDPRCTYQTTINGQLYLICLAEELELNGIHVVSANTDGIVSLFDKSLEDTYNSICKAWEERFKFELEFTEYERYIRSNVNNYIAIKKGFYKEYDAVKNTSNLDSVRKTLEKDYVKRKGLFIDNPEFSMGFQNPITSTVLNDYYIYGDDVMESLTKYANTPDRIYDFCITQKVDKKFEVQHHYIKDNARQVDILQQYNRFYVSNQSTGNILKFDPTTKRLTSIIAHRNLKLLNVYRDEPIDDLHLGYYYNECMKIIYGKNKNVEGISDIKLNFNYDPDAVNLITEEDLRDINIGYDDEVADDFVEEYQQLYNVGDDLPF